MERPVETWPVCPACQKPRMAVCPYCRTSGTGFPLADEPPAADSPAEMSPAPGPAGVADESSAMGGCSAGCGCGGSAPSSATAAEPGPSDGEEGPQSPLRLCPTCDEAFVPRFLPRCEWCGFQFDDQPADVTDEGQRFLGPGADDADRANPRVVVAIIVTLVVMAAIGLYFALIIGR